jgi:Phage portal protein
VNFRQRLSADIQRRFAGRESAREEQRASPPGKFSFGTGVYGGPAFVDAFNSRRGPNPYELIERCRGLLYAMVARNRDGVTRVPLRLYADGSRAMGKPNRNCDPIRVSRNVGERLFRAGHVSSAAVDQVYEIRTHPLLERLDKPDPYGYFDRKKLLGLMCSYCDIVGQGFLVPEGNGWDYRRPDDGRKKGPPDYLWVLYSQYVYPIRDSGDALVDYWQYYADRLPYEATLRFRHSISFRDAYGSAYSPIYAGAMYSDQEERYTAIWDQILGIGARPNLIVSAKDAMMPPGPDERLRFDQDLNRKTSGGNAGRIVVTNGAWEFTPINYQQADMAANQLQQYDREVLATIFGQPPTYYTVNSNLANLTAADEQFARTSVEPRCDSIASTLTDLVQRWDKRLFFKFDPAIQEDDESREKVISMRLASGRATINQVNEEDKYPAVPWGDQPWIAATLKQPDMIQEAHDQGLEQQKSAVESQQKRDEFELRDQPADDAAEKMRSLLRISRERLMRIDVMRVAS